MTNSGVRLFTLGALDLRRDDGAELRSVLAQPRRIALLVYLALSTPRGPHRRDRLLALFWPDQDEGHARNALSQAVYFLRNSLGADAVVSRTAEELALDQGKVWCDAVAFGEAMDSGRFMDAIELYRGELLTGFHVAGAGAGFADWIETTRSDYSRRYEFALQRAAAERERVGDYAGALTWRRRLAAQDPLNSDAALQLMRALAAAGDPAAAIKHARVHETMLREQLGAPPDAKIAQFVKSLQKSPPVENSPTLPAPGSSPPGPVVAPTMTAANSVATSLTTPVPATHDRPGRWRYVAAAAALAGAGVLGVFAFARARATPADSSCVAVLPFANYSEPRAQDDLADAVSDAVLTDLARFQRLRVISRSSTIRYKGTQKRLPEIASELGCKTAVEGSVVHDGNRVQVDAQLVDATSDRHIWAERYDREMVYLNQLEQDIAEGVAEELHAVESSVHPLGSEAPALASARRADPITYGLYLRGRDAVMSRDPAGLRLAIRLYKQAIGRDSTFALGYAGLADAYRTAGGLGYMPETYADDTAPKMARTALTLDGNLSEAHTSMGGVFGDAGDWPAAEREFRRAIELAPSNARAHHWYAIILAILDRKQKAVREIRRALELDPLDQAVRATDDAIEVYAGIRSPTHHLQPRKTLVDPNYPRNAAVRSINLAREHRCPEAYEENKIAQQLAPNNTLTMTMLVGVRFLCGDRKGAMSLLAQVKRRPDADQQGSYIAEVFLAMNQLDSAFAWLNRNTWGLNDRLELRTSTALAPIRKDPRYHDILHRAKML